VQYGNSIGIVDNMVHEVNQMVFPQGELENNVVMQQNPDSYQLSCNLQGNSTSTISFFVGLSQFKPDKENYQANSNYWSSLIENISSHYFEKISNSPLDCFDYQAAIRQYNISYIALRNLESMPRFSDDPMFTLVFKNDQVAIFKVIKSP
jgi:hypothetical protein